MNVEKYKPTATEEWSWEKMLRRKKKTKRNERERACANHDK